MSALAGYMWTACLGPQRSSSKSFCKDTCGLRLAVPVGLAAGAGGADLTDPALSSVSVSVRGRGSRMAGAASKKSQGSSSPSIFCEVPK